MQRPLSTRMPLRRSQLNSVSTCEGVLDRLSVALSTTMCTSSLSTSLSMRSLRWRCEPGEGATHDVTAVRERRKRLLPYSPGAVDRLHGAGRQSGRGRAMAYDDIKDK